MEIPVLKTRKPRIELCSLGEASHTETRWILLHWEEKRMRYGQFLRAKRISDSRELMLKDVARELGVSVSFSV